MADFTFIIKWCYLSCISYKSRIKFYFFIFYETYYFVCIRHIIPTFIDLPFWFNNIGI